MPEIFSSSNLFGWIVVPIGSDGSQLLTDASVLVSVKKSQPDIPSDVILFDATFFA
jgi:hypothetical protein